MAKKIDIIIPIHNALLDVRKCLDSVEKSLLKGKHNLIIVDDGSDEETKKYLKEFATIRNRYVTLIRNEITQKYTKSANIGLKASTGDYVILLNSDTVVSPNWTEKLIECAQQSSNIGIVGPMSNAASWQSAPKVLDKNGQFIINSLPKNITIKDMDLMCEKFSFNLFPEVELVNGFCFLIKRKVLNTIGFFDENSYPNGYGEENDYCFRAKDFGFKLAIATHTYVYHSKSKRFGYELRKSLSERAQIIFEQKYGVTRIYSAIKSTQNNALLNYVREKIDNSLSNI